jgi:hypothetical protein
MLIRRESESLCQSISLLAMVGFLVWTQPSAPASVLQLPLREHVADAADLGANSFQFFFDLFVASVDVVDAVDDGLAVGD